MECLDLCIKLNPDYECAYWDKGKIIKYFSQNNRRLKKF